MESLEIYSFFGPHLVKKELSSVIRLFTLHFFKSCCPQDLLSFLKTTSWCIDMDLSFMVTDFKSMFSLRPQTAEK